MRLIFGYKCVKEAEWNYLSSLKEVVKKETIVKEGWKKRV